MGCPREGCSDSALKDILTLGEVVTWLTNLFFTLVAVSWVVVRREVLFLAILANHHLIVFAHGQVLREVLLATLLEPIPSGLSKDTSLIGLFNLCVMEEFESSSLDREHLLCAFLFDDIFNAAILFSMEIKIMLWIEVLLEMTGHLVKVCVKITRVRLHYKVDEELDELLLRRCHVGLRFHKRY